MNNKGFVTIFLVSAIPVIIALALAFNIFTGILKYDLELKYICRNEGILAMEKVAQELTSLMKLNTKAQSLRQQLKSAKLKLAFALVSENPTAILAAESQIHKIELERHLLDSRQKLLISNANRTLLIQTQKIQKSIQRKSINVKNRVEEFLVLQTNIQIKNQGRLAVMPDLPEVAPVYRIQDNFDQKQAMAFSWQLGFQVKAFVANFLKAQGQIERSCAITLNETGETWHAKLIKMDKS